MADFVPNFNLEDALTDTVPKIEPQIKRDFISMLEAEPFDDVIGETCDKVDYVPLLDDETKEPKHKPNDGGPEDGEPEDLCATKFLSVHIYVCAGSALLCV
uniref:Uncharacterized protein n=1 Tax=Leptobrachium leishanense TaxID=445787 RepID=A0A8C5MPA0_9ANUR